MVGRLTHLSRLGARLAQRRLRDLFRGALVRGKSWARRVRVERAPGSRGLSRRGRQSLSPADRVQPLSQSDRSVRSPSLRERQPRAAHAAAGHRRRAVLQVAESVLHAASRRQCDHAGLAARVRGRHRPQPRFFLRPMGVQGRASGDRSHQFVRRQEKTAERHGQADPQNGRHDCFGVQLPGDDRADGCRRKARRAIASR